MTRRDFTADLIDAGLVLSPEDEWRIAVAEADLRRPPEPASEELDRTQDRYDNAIYDPPWLP